MIKRRVYIWTLLVFGLLSWNNPCLALRQSDNVSAGHALHLFFHADTTHTDSEWLLHSKLASHLSDLEKIKARQASDYRFLKTLFFKTHRQLLKQYTPAATFTQTMTDGRYGCVTGTALYAVLLSHFNYDYEIMELPGHVYLKVHLADQDLLIESTLSLDGFITDKKKIHAATKQYETDSRKNNSIMAVSGINAASGSEVGFERQIDLKQLSGLQYYNMAIYSLGDGAYQEAFDNAEKAEVLYPSNRTKKLMQIVINKILQSKNLSKDQKVGILNNYITQVRKKKLTQR